MKLNFLERRSAVRKPTLAYQASAYDGYGNGELEWFSHTDMDKNGVVDQADKELIRSCAAVSSHSPGTQTAPFDAAY